MSSNVLVILWKIGLCSIIICKMFLCVCYIHIYFGVLIFLKILDTFHNILLLNGDIFQVHGTGLREMLLSYSFLSCIKYVLSVVNNFKL